MEHLKTRVKKLNPRSGQAQNRNESLTMDCKIYCY